MKPLSAKTASAVLGTALMVFGCSATPAPGVPLDVGTLERSRPRTLLLVHSHGAAFQKIAPDLTPFSGGLMAVAAASIEAQRLRNEHHIDDPALALGDAVAAAFARQHGLNVQSMVEERGFPPRHSNAVSRRGPRRPETDLTFEFRTAAWGILALHSNDAAVFCGFSARLIDNRTKWILAEGECDLDDLQSQRAAKRSYEDLVANDAAILKRELTAAVDECFGKISGRLLGGSAANAAPTTPLPPDGGPS